jgi:glycosyltransferase involved in cell wall biosynthesis
MSSELVSVVIPTYNNQDTIAVCLDSIRSQTYELIEVIVVDGGSSDRTISICENYGVSIVNTDLGMAASRLEGARESEGEYLFHVDSDMELSEKVIEECVDNMKQYDALIIPEINVGDTYWAQCTDIGKSISRENRVGNARFLSRNLYFNVDGHNPELLHREDREFHELLEMEGSFIGHTTECIIHHIGKMRLIDILLKRYRYLLSLEDFNVKSRVDEEEIENKRQVNHTSVIFKELKDRPSLIPGYVLITVLISTLTSLVRIQHEIL